MSDKRILYSAQALYVGPSPATGAQASGNITQLHRVQSVSYDYTRQLEDVKQFGILPPIDRIETQLPQVSLNTTYLATNVANESGIGLYVGGDVSALKDILLDNSREKNYFLRVVSDGNSAYGYTPNDSHVVGFGNGVLSSYQAQGAVGGFPTAQFTVQALDASWSATSSNFDTPAVDPQTGQPITGYSVTLPIATTGLVGQPTALRPGDITVDLAGAGLGVKNLLIQNYNMQFDLNLESLTALGYQFAFSREPQFPVNAELSVEANMRDMGTGRLSTLRCNNAKYDLSVKIRKPTCDGSLGPIQIVYTLKGATLDSQSFNSTIGPSKSVTMKFSAPVSGPQETGVGLFISGSLV